VFYRTNAQSRVFEEVFIRTGQPYKVVGGVRFYERREVRDALAYLRMLVNTADEISLRRVLNTPKRGIGDRAVACIAALADRDRITFWEALVKAEQAPGLATRSLKNILGFVAMVQELQSMVAAAERPDVILESVLERSGYLAELEASDDPQDDTRVENLAELVAVAREFAEDPQPGPSADPADIEAGTVAVGLGDFLERVALVADAAWGAPSHNPASRFLDELPVDLVDWRRTAAEQTRWGRPDLTARSARLGSPTDAGRRNFTSAAMRADAAAKAKPAREIPSLTPGDRVVHDSFGMGTVVAVDGVAEKSVASIDFGSDGVKRLLLRYAPVEKL